MDASKQLFKGLFFCWLFVLIPVYIGKTPEKGLDVYKRQVFVWCISVPIAYVLSRYTQLPIIGIFAAVQTADLLKCVVGYALVKKGVWLQNIVS